MNPETQYMGKPCKRGHSGLRYMCNRECVECKKIYMREYRHLYKKSEAGKETQRRYAQSPKGRETKRRRDARRGARRIRMKAGGINFSLGYAPTAEDAQRIREKIKREAP